METNCVIAIKMIDEDDIESHPPRAIIDDCKNLLKVNKANITHVKREVRGCLDFLFIKVTSKVKAKTR